MRLRRESQSTPESDPFDLPDPAQQAMVNPEDEQAVIPQVGSIEYFIQAPEVISMIGKTRQLSGILAEFRGTTVETIKSKIEESNMPRAAKRAFISAGMPNAAADAAKALGHLLAQPGQYPNGDIPARYNAAAAALGPFRNQIHELDESAVYQDIYTAASNIEPLLKAYWSNSESLNNRLQLDLADDPSARFQLAKIISTLNSPTNAGAEAPYDQKNAEMLLKLLSNPQLRANSLPVTICQEIADGYFDSVIAAEILEGSQEPGVRKLIELIERATGASLDKNIMENLSVASDAWPKDAASILLDRRNLLLQSIYTSSQHATAELSQSLGIKDEATTAQERFKIEMEKLIRSVHNVRRPAMGDAAPQVMRKRFATTGRPAVRRVVSIPTVPTPEVIKSQPNTLTFVDKDGNIYPEDSEKYREMIDKITTAYKGTPGIQEDIQAILRYLSNLDFNTPNQRRGLEKMSEGDWLVMIDGQPQKRPLYRFKALEAPGLSIRNQVIKRHRVLLTLVDNETLGLIGIVHKDKFAQFLKGAGIGTTVRGS